MPALSYGLSSYERGEGNLPELPVVNMYAEEAASEESGVVLQSRRGLADRAANMSVGPVKALFRRDLVLGSELLGVSGGRLYRGTNDVGSVTVPGFTTIAGNEIGAMIAGGGPLYYYDGTTLATVAYPDGAAVAHVFAGGSRFWTVRKDTGKIYWTDPLEADKPPLNFATAESLPDRLLQGLWIDGMAILFGKESIEFWQQTGGATLPITPLQNMVIEEGIKSTGCAVRIGETFAAVSSENRVIMGIRAEVISNPGLQEQIGASATHSLFTFLIDGVEFLALRLDNETQVYNSRTGTWSKFETDGLSNWGVQCHADGVFGSAVDGKTLAWATGYLDSQSPGETLERRFRGGFAINGGGVMVTNVSLRANPGETPFLTGDHADPSVEMRLSRNAGRTWNNWRQASLGAQGDYRNPVQWRGLGQASRPGFLAEFRCSSPVPFRVSGVFANEQWGGR